jgi:hypothetical protein
VWKGEGRGRMANAPPPEAFQFTAMYCCCYIRDGVRNGGLDWMMGLTPDEEMMLVSHALFVTLTFSYPFSFFVGCPKTWLYDYQYVILIS